MIRDNRTHIVALILLSVCIGCSALPPPEMPTRIGESDNLEFRERMALYDQVDGGHDKDAAFRIASYYCFSEGDTSACNGWLSTAAHLGHSEAQKSLGESLLGSAIPAERFLGEYWVCTAASNGHDNAAQLVKRRAFLCEKDDRIDTLEELNSFSAKNDPQTLAKRLLNNPDEKRIFLAFIERGEPMAIDVAHLLLQQERSNNEEFVVNLYDSLGAALASNPDAVFRRFNTIAPICREPNPRNRRSDNLSKSLSELDRRSTTLLASVSSTDNAKVRECFHLLEESKSRIVIYFEEALRNSNNLSPERLQRLLVEQSRKTIEGAP